MLDLVCRPVQNTHNVPVFMCLCVHSFTLKVWLEASAANHGVPLHNSYSSVGNQQST